MYRPVELCGLMGINIHTKGIHTYVRVGTTIEKMKVSIGNYIYRVLVIDGYLHSRFYSMLFHYSVYCTGW